MKAIDVSVQKSSGNVYADIGVADAEAMAIKAELVSVLARISEERNYTQAKVAKLTGIPQPKLSAVLRGRFRGVSEDRLMRAITALGSDVSIVVSKPVKGRAAILSVAAA